MLALQTNIKEVLSALDLLTHYKEQIKLAYFEGGKRFLFKLCQYLFIGYEF